MFELKPDDLHLAVEFKAQPYGHHSPALEAALDQLRMVNPLGKFIAVRTGVREWTVAHLEGEPPHAVLHEELRLPSARAAEWAVFKLRWEALTGEPLEFE